MKVSHILSAKVGDVVSISPEQTIHTAVKKLVAHNIGALVVLDADDNLIGILSERDVIRRASQTDNVLTLSVAEVIAKSSNIGAAKMVASCRSEM